MQVDVRSNINAVVARLNAHRQDVVNKAIPRALNRTGEMATTAASRVVRSEGYNFKAAEIKDAIRMTRASVGRLVTSLRVRRRTKSLLEFNAVQTKEGVRVKVHGQAKLIRHAFIGQLRNGRLGVYIEDKSAGKTVLRMAKQYKRGSRGGWQDYPVRKLFGPSVGGVYGTDRIQQVVLPFIGRTFADRLAHEIKNLSR